VKVGVGLHSPGWPSPVGCIVVLALSRRSAVIQTDAKLLFCSLLEGQTAATEPFRARSKTSCAADVGGDGKVPDARRAVSRRLQALRAAAAPHRFQITISLPPGSGYISHIGVGVGG